jgi:hypothetical protein
MKELALTINNNWTIDPPAGVPKGGSGATEQIIQFGVGFLIVVAILITLLYLIWGGIDYITSEGKKDKMERAKKKITYAIVGIVIVFIAFVIVTIVGNLFSVNYLGSM